MKIAAGEVVVMVLHTPREKLVGVLEEIGPAGVQIRGIDLGYFDDWSQSVAANEPHLAMTDYFFPMWRVERVSRDEGTEDVPSLAGQFERRTGKVFTEQ